MSMRRRSAAHISGKLAAVRADYAFAATDAALMTAAYLLVFFITTDNSTAWQQPVGRVVLVAPTVHLLCNALFGLYGLLWRHIGIDEARRLMLAGAAATVALAAVSVTFSWLAAPIALLGPILATLMTGLSRFRSRLFAWQRGSRNTPGSRIVVVGAGHVAVGLVRDLINNPQRGHTPVAIVDDNRRLHGRTVSGVPVIGGLADLPALAPDMVINQIVLAVPSASAELVQRAADVADSIGVPLKIMPAPHELISGVPHLRQVRKPRIEDLLGRAQVDTDLAAVGELVQGRTVLLTGAGGSIGSEIARQVACFGPTRLVLLDHDETHLYDASASVRDQLGAAAVEMLTDIRDQTMMEQVFATYRPDIVFHAAAHKHVPMLERFPLEAISTNVLGTLNLLDAAVAGGTERFVLISTDKAVRPSNVMGATKRLGEQLLAARAASHPHFCAVRFGNVLGSRGSVVPTFERQIASGGPVTVTDPDMTRYFMSITEAVQLVLQAAVFAENNDLFLLEMGEPVRIVDLARQMIHLSGYAEHEIEITMTGTRAGEKKEEELHAPSEQVLATAHPSIARLVPIRPSPSELDFGVERLRLLVEERRGQDAKDLLFELVSSSDEPYVSARSAPAMMRSTAPAGFGPDATAAARAAAERQSWVP